MLNAPPSSQHQFNIRIAGFDLIWIALAPFISLWLRGENYLDIGDLPFNPSPTLHYALITSFATSVAFILLRVSEGISYHFSARDAVAIFFASALSVMASISAVFTFSRLEGVPRSVPFIYGLVLVFGILFHRLLMRSLNERNRVSSDILSASLKQKSIRRVIIIGIDPFAIAAMRLVEKQLPVTTQIVAAFSLQGKYAGRSISKLRIFANLHELGSIIDEYYIHGVAINEIWISDNSQYINDEIKEFIQQQAEVRHVVHKSLSDALGLSVCNMVEEDEGSFIDNMPHLNESYLKLKRILDLVGSTLLSIILAPILVIVIIITIYDVGFPIIFWQERLGYHGKILRVYKIRTMKNPVASDGGLIADQVRTSIAGKWIRYLRLDESPQLISIIVGEMSGIGPRPLLQREQTQGPLCRLLLRPGITGWAQVNGGELLTFEEKNILDSWYVFNVSLILDVEIILKTIKVLFEGVQRNEKAIDQARDWLKKHQIS